MNNAIDFILELDILKNMSVSVAFRLGIAGTFYCSQVLFRILCKSKKADCNNP